MTVAERLRKEGEIRGEMRGEIRGRIEAYKELATGGLLSKDIADQKIAELEQKLKEMTGQSRSDTEH